MPTELFNVRSIFDCALEIASEAERQAYLDEACAAAPEMREQVEALLSAYANAGSFLEVANDGQRISPLDPILEGPGTVIGILPGSRKHELVYNTPSLLKAAQIIHARRPAERERRHEGPIVRHVAARSAANLGGG